MPFITELIEKYKLTASADEAAAFEEWLVSDAWNRYIEHRMNLENLARSAVDGCKITIPNGFQSKEYAPVEIVLPVEGITSYSFANLEALGLKATEVEFGRYIISGTPLTAGDFTIELEYTYPGWGPWLPKPKRLIPFAVNANPRLLWDNKATPEDIEYFKTDTDCDSVKVTDPESGEQPKSMVAASYRGRSHAHTGRPRDDHFALHYCAESKWYIMVVADGAGSAPFSRKGSELACDTVVDCCKENLSNNPEFESLIAECHQDPSNKKALMSKVYGIVGNAAFKAHKHVCAFAQSNNRSPKEYATTLLFTISKKFKFGWFVASFWVGDGAICIYDQLQNTATMLGEPDEGEYSGQTRFLTMPDIFADHATIMKRIVCGIVPDFTALILMTDGVSDPMFGTDAALKNVDCWHKLWRNLKNGFSDDNIPGIDLSPDNEEAKDQLLKWLEFWVPGEHDDRTIAMLY